MTTCKDCNFRNGYKERKLKIYVVRSEKKKKKVQDSSWETDTHIVTETCAMNNR